MTRRPGAGWTIHASWLLVVLGCDRRPDPPALEGALTDIPVYSPATVVKRLVYPSPGPACPLETLIWKLETPDEWAKLLFFYRQKLSFVVPEVGTGAAQGRTLFEYLPDGGDQAKRERVLVAVDVSSTASGTKFRIEETVCASRRTSPG